VSEKQRKEIKRDPYLESEQVAQTAINKAMEMWKNDVTHPL
jgi:hypothetical protein